MNSPYDDPHGDLLGRALKAEADRIVPAGDGLTRIRERVERRRSRVRWLMPAASLATAGALAGAAFGAYTVVSGHDDSLNSRLAHNPSATPPTSGPAPSGTATPTPTPSGSVAPVIGTSVSPVWPFSSYAEAQAWQRDYASGGHSPWHLDAEYTAQSFIETLLLPKQSLTTGGVKNVSSREVTVDMITKTTGNGGPHVLGQVHLVRWGTGSNAPWEVTGVTTSGARIDSPTAGTAVSSPVVVHYTLDGGVEEDVYASIWDGRGRLASGHANVGGGAQQAGLTFGTPSTSNGYVVVADVQTAAGPATLSRLMVVPVRFAGSSGSTTATGKHYPPFFLAVSNDRIGLYYSTLGGFGRWLTAAQPGTVSSPQLSGDGKWVYFLRTTGGTGSVMRVSIDGGAEQPVVTGKGDVTAFAIGGQDAERLVYVTTAADGSQHVSWSSDKAGSGSFPVPAAPPLFEQLAWAPDGMRFTAQVRTGNTWALMTYDAASTTTMGSGSAVPAGEIGGNEAQGPTYDAAGNLYFVRTVDATHLELVQWNGKQLLHVSTYAVPADEGSPESTTVDITPDAYAAIVTTPRGEIYRVEEGQAHLLPTSASGATW